MKPEGETRILIVDDDEDYALLIRTLLAESRPAFAVESSATLAAALARLARGGIDAVLLDLSLPDAQGLETFTRLHAQVPELPILVFTGRDEVALAARIVREGGQDYIVKGSIDGPALDHAVRQGIRRQRLEGQVRQTKAFLANVIENIPLMIFIKDAADLRFVMLNKTGEELLGYSASELVGKSDYDIFPREEADFFVAKDRHVLESGRLLDIPEEPIETRHGRRFLHTKKIPIADGAGKPLYLVGISEDITQRKRMEKALRESEEKLFQVQKMDAIGRMASGIAHDFNNYLTAILGFGEMMLGTFPEDDPRREDLQEIVNTAQRGAGLTRQLQAFGRKQLLEPKVLELDSVLTDMRPMLAKLAGPDTELSISPGAGTSRVKVDPIQLQQVVMNLAINSRDAMPKGGELAIVTRLVEADAAFAGAHPGLTPGPHIMITVSDTGSGMAPEVLERAFEPFFTTKPRGQGTGLGLSTAYGIVKQSGGHIGIRSAPGTGTTFEVCLPVVTEAVTPAQLRKRANAPTGTETILLVEDEESVRKLTERFLSGLGYRVLEASDGVAALKLAESRNVRFDLLLTDVVMPRMGGRELAEEFAKAHPKARILFISGYTEDAVVSQGLVAGDVPFLRKPFTPPALAEKVRSVLDAPRG